MKLTNEKGITLIALIVTVIVMLIMSGVAINATIGENGLITKVTEALLLTKLGDILFDIESDLVSVKMDYYNTKLTTSDTFDVLAANAPNKYTLNYSLSLTALNWSIANSPIQNLVFGFTGDVYVDNYKRGKVQISDIYEERLIENLYYGNSNIKVNDGYIQTFDTPGLIGINYTYNNENLPWINQDGDIVAWANRFLIYPRGITDYDVATFDASWFNEVANHYTNRYNIFITAGNKQFNDSIIFEINAHHYPITTMINCGLKSFIVDGNPMTSVVFLTMGGTHIKSGGIIFSDIPDFSDPSRVFSYSIDTPYSLSYSGDPSVMENYAFSAKISDIQNLFYDETKETPSIFYYMPFVVYQKYAYDDEATGDHLYYTEENTAIGSSIKKIVIE